MDSFESTVLKKYRRLSQFLIVSSLLNVAFVSSAIYQYFKPVKALEWATSKAPLTEDATSVLKSFLSSSYQDLVSKLALKTQIEPGLYKRDLALAVLHDSYSIDIARALSRLNLHFQPLSYLDGHKQKWIQVPRGLSDSEFELVIQFIKQEAWPLTSKGLFLKLKFGIKEGPLQQAFHRCYEFSRLYDALSAQIPNFKQDMLESVLLKGEFQDFEIFCEGALHGGFSVESFLNHYTKLGSQVAALILIEDSKFSVKQLSDLEALDLIDVLNGKEDKQKKIAQELLNSFRSDQFKQEIKKRGFIEETVLLSAQAIEKKEPPQIKMIPEAKTAPVKATAHKDAKTYVVQEGDSLWKISRKFKVDVETLKAVNHLDSENLKPGKVLKIP